MCGAGNYSDGNLVASLMSKQMQACPAACISPFHTRDCATLSPSMDQVAFVGLNTIKEIRRHTRE